MKRECFKEVVLPIKERRLAGELETSAKMRSTKTAVVFQGWKRYVEAEEEE